MTRKWSSTPISRSLSIPIRLFFIMSLLTLFATKLHSQKSLVAPPQGANYTGVYRFTRPDVGKCLDVGGYPLTNSSAVIQYTCNGTTAQDLTLVPFEAPVDGTVEIHVQGRCLGVVQPPLLTDGFSEEARREFASDVILPIVPPAAGWQVVLQPCSGSTLQRFYVPGPSALIIPKENRSLAAEVAESAPNHTQLLLEPISTASPTLWGYSTSETWVPQQFDTTDYSFPAARETNGSYTFQGFAGKCIDVGGSTPPQYSPVFLYGCNGTIAQSFSIASVNDHLGFYTISAYGKCFDVDGGVITAGAGIQINSCTGAKSQQFAFDHYDRNYIYPAGNPSLVVGVAGGNSTNRTPLILEPRDRVDYQNWQAVASDSYTTGPKAPDVRWYVNGYNPFIEVRTNSTELTTQEVYFRPIDQDDNMPIASAGATSGPQQSVWGLTSLDQLLLKLPVAEFYIKVRATNAQGQFSDSPEILVDARELDYPKVSVSDIGSDRMTINVISAGTPQAKSIQIWLQDLGGNAIASANLDAAPGNGVSDVSYSHQFTGLQPNTKYAFQVYPSRVQWQSHMSTGAATTTAPAPITTTIDMTRSTVYQGNIPYAGAFGPIYPGGATVTNINFPLQFPAVWLVRKGYSTESCGVSGASILVHGDMTAAQKQFIWGSSSITVSGVNQQLDFVGCSASTGATPSFLPVNITWTKF